MLCGCFHPDDHEGRAKAKRVHVAVDLVYERDTPLFWYMRDDHPFTLACNLSQEPWGLNFLKTCVNRTSNHGHYEDFGRARGTVTVHASDVATYNFGTFRDHSWDIRRWAAMDHWLILLISLHEPLEVFPGEQLHYLDLTLVNMPGNISGVQRYSTGYAMGVGKDAGPRRPVTVATSILDEPWVTTKESGERRPPPTSDVVMYLRSAPHEGGDRPVRVEMSGDIRTLLYWPDGGSSICFEDSMDFTITDLTSGLAVKGYGIRQTGFRLGEFDPTLGGCG